MRGPTGQAQPSHRPSEMATKACRRPLGPEGLKIPVQNGERSPGRLRRGGRSSAEALSSGRSGPGEARGGGRDSDAWPGRDPPGTARPRSLVPRPVRDHGAAVHGRGARLTGTRFLGEGADMLDGFMGNGCGLGLGPVQMAVDPPITFPNTTWPWTFLSILTVCGALVGAVISIALVALPLTPKLLGFYSFSIASVALLSLALGVARSWGSPKILAFHAWGITGTISYPRWIGRGVDSLSIPYSRIQSVTRWLPGWAVATDIPVKAIRGRRFVTVSDANAVRIRRAWEAWKSTVAHNDGTRSREPSESCR